MKEFTFPGGLATGEAVVNRTGQNRRNIFSVLTLVLFFISTSIFAQHPYGFLDENVRNDDGKLDWEDIWNAQQPDGVNILPAGSVTTDILFDAFAPDTIYFGGNTKDHLPISGWDWQTSNASSSDKTNILESGAILIGGKIYFFGNKFAAEGTTTIGFWFFQDEVQIDPDGGFIGEHTIGDILIVADVEQGGAVGFLRAYRYVGEGNGELPNSNKAFNELDTEIGIFGDLYGVVNTLEQPTPWPHQSKNYPPNLLPPITFFEGFIDIASLGLANACFSSFLMETRSSNPVNAALEDFNLGGFNVTPSVSLEGLVICEDELPASLTASVEGGLGIVEYEWRKNGELLGETSSTLDILDIEDAGSYSVIAIGEGIGGVGNCPSEPAIASVTINPLAIADAGDDQEICIVDGSETVQLAGSIDGGASSASWSSSGDGDFNDASALDAVYTPGENDLINGTVTLTLTTDDPDGPCDAADDDVVIEFFEDPVADAGEDQEICIVDGSETVQLAGSIDGGASSASWTSSGDGNFNDASALDAVYTPGENDLINGTVTLTLTTDDPEGPCDAADDDVVIDFFEDPTVAAGDDQFICIVDGSETVQLAGSIDGGASSASWTSSGDGDFNDASALNAVYTPGENDISNGSVTLTLTTDDPEGPCDAAEDDVVIYFFEDPDAGEDGSAQFCYGDANYSSVDLFDLLQGNPDEGGSWMETSITSSGLTLGDGSGLDFTMVEAGVYIFKYTVGPVGENSTCEPDDATVTITIDPLPDVPEYQTSLADCLGGDGGLVLLNVGDNMYYSIDGGPFILYDGEIALAVGFYDIRIRYDEDGCISEEFEVQIQRPNEDIVTLIPEVTPPDCETFMGAIMITNAGVLGDLNYTVTNTDTSTDYYSGVSYPMGGFTGLPAGNYYISAISDNGCITGNVMVTLDEPICDDFEGCTLGYWKNHTDRWCDAYRTCDIYGDIFPGAPSQLANLTLLEALNLGGGGVYNLGRQSVAALLNACSEEVNYELATPQDVINYVTAHFANAGEAGSYLDMLNNAGDCPMGGSRATTAPSDNCSSVPDSFDAAAGISVSPVPFKDKLNIRYEFDYKSDATIQIFDLRGNLVKTQKESNASFGKVTEINADFVRGEQMYIIKVTTNQGTYTKNVVSGKQ
ncbi:Por secretion system C-terminal sorting domain-containing protein [Salinimicrobium sediminis]|uniref:Por secretion system C-terminal sorting domain-containing protein n=1 Tax=Salinimicrobium sediminis TaxID=1343891 RepID=A0A285X7C2_9FLAO|nr:T9SS type A sorting domain-containing protein [Salinimicrobium sediminis]SOC80674.1 Por secretion system C-terminal sorting domain-containing protein [Salinimicrobium sediminis]